MNIMQRVTVYQTFSSADAQLIQSLLQASGIEAEVVNELSSLSLDGYSLAAGGILVKVADDRVAEARALILSKNQSSQ